MTEKDHGNAAVPDQSSKNPFRRFKHSFTGHNNGAQGIGTDDYAPPPGPPPSQYKSDTKSHITSDDDYRPPPGPPPGHGKHEKEADDVEPPPYDPWLSVPDNSSLPPPPSITYEASPTNNATEDSAARGRHFTQTNPLYIPRPLREGELSEIVAGHLALTKPPNLQRSTLTSARPGTWHIRTIRGTDDAILLTSLPMYAAAHHDPSRTGRPYTAYFEVKVIRLDASPNSGTEMDALFGIGFIAPPYPPFRLPGWERGSLGVHSDDGRRYVNDNRGGRDLTTAFQEGDVVGIGMRLSPPWRQGERARVEVFFTRNGSKAGSWDLWEERPAHEEDIGNPEGLGGDRDIVGALGVSGAVELEWRGRKDEWLYRPDLNPS